VKGTLLKPNMCVPMLTNKVVAFRLARKNVNLYSLGHDDAIMMTEQNVQNTCMTIASSFYHSSSQIYRVTN